MGFLSFVSHCLSLYYSLPNSSHLKLNLHIFLLLRIIHIFFFGYSSMTYKSVTYKSAVNWQTNHITSKKRIKVLYQERVITLALQISNRCCLPSLSTGMFSIFNFFFRVSYIIVFYFHLQFSFDLLKQSIEGHS